MTGEKGMYMASSYSSKSKIYLLREAFKKHICINKKNQDYKYINAERIIHSIAEYRIKNLFYTIAQKDPMIITHLWSVAQWGVDIADLLGLSMEEKYKVYVACMLHDVGKLHISKEILLKSSSLSEDEYTMIKNHATYGCTIVKPLVKGISFLEDLPAIICHHHEKYDGSGYPNKLKGESIPFISRIIGVADAVDVMLSPRPYKKEKSLDYVIEELKLQRGLQFDPTIADMGIKLLENYEGNTMRSFEKKHVCNTF